ncbi:MAG TPA: aminotransferase class V-fold PLP-dependent enzyme [Geobacteraceae bacterium]|nr:aminotransferase class V-fold PLP-dependent enzyme [Geobacteraceae bacterium]
MSIYLDNAATSFPKPEDVYRAVEHALREIGVGPGRGSHRRALSAGRLVFQAREAAAALFGVKDAARLIFTHSATESLNLAVNGLLEPGDHVVSTTMEHNSLARPLRLAEQRGVAVTRVGADNCGLVDVRLIREAIREDTRLVAITHCSNVTGAIQPVGDIGKITRERGIALLVDAAQSAGVMPLDVNDLNIDLLAAPGHKGLFGPPGTGILHIAEGVELKPVLVGGTGGWSTSELQPDTLPERFESGTMNTPGIAGLLAGVEFVLATGVQAIRRKETALVTQLVEGLKAIPGITVFAPGREEERGGVLSFTVSGRDPVEIGFRLDRDYDIAVRVGLHCAPEAHRTIGTFPGGTVRVSPGYFNTDHDIEEFLRALRSMANAG